MGGTLDGERVGDVVGDARADGDAWDGALDLRVGFVERGGADVDGLVEDVRLDLGERAQQDAGLAGGAGAELGDGEGGGMREGNGRGRGCGRLRVAVG